MRIDQFRYIKIQPKTIDLSTRLVGIKPHKLCIYSHEPRTEVYCFWLNFNISKLVYLILIRPRCAMGRITSRYNTWFFLMFLKYSSVIYSSCWKDLSNGSQRTRRIIGQTKAKWKRTHRVDTGYWTEYVLNCGVLRFF